MAAAEHRMENLTLESARSLKPGDVIENLYYLIWHPYVVERVIPPAPGEDEENGHVTIGVIHYGRRDLLEGITVLQENITLDFNNASSFRLYVFPAADCRPDDEVVQLARGRIGEAAHGILNNNNATYFVLSCKLTDEAFQRHKQSMRRFRFYNPFSG